MNTYRRLSLGLAAPLALMATLQGQQSGQEPDQDPYRFKSGVELINVTATVSDRNGRFVSGLTKDDFILYDNDVRQTISHFSAERVPVSLGLTLDTSGSMAGEKIDAARAALDRFLYDLLDRDDEVFLYRFSDQPFLLQGWTTDRLSVSRALGRITPNGGTALYEAVAEAVPLTQQGRHQKKALLIVSDGNDTASQIGLSELKRIIRRSEVLVYAVGIDGDGESTLPRAPITRPQPRRPPIPIPFPGGPRRVPGRRFPQIGFGPAVDAQAGPRPQILGPRSSWPGNQPSDDRVNVAALRELTDDSGGRTEIVRRPADLRPATAGIADELSKQYYLGYASSGEKDGQWHSIRVEVRPGSYQVRARRGYMAN